MVGNILNFLNTTLGLSSESLPFNNYDIINLPIYLKKGFNFNNIVIDKVEYLAIEPLQVFKGSVLVSSAKKISELSGKHTLILLSQIDSTLRRSLITAKTDFIVPNKQIYLPSMCLYLNERGLSERINPKTTMSPSAQLLILYHLQVKSLTRLTLKDIAPILQYSTKTISLVANELVNAGICELQSQGKSKFLTFIGEGKDIWNKVKEIMSSPIIQVCYTDVIPNSIEPLLLKSGDTALSHYTFMAETRQQTFAIEKRSPLIKDLTINDSEGKIRMELWKYNPMLLSNSPYVDKLSLSLCYKEDEDERIDKEIEQMTNKIQW